jgi:zinc protease
VTLLAADRVTRTVLPNGLVVLVKAATGSGSVVLQGYIRAGAMFDADRPGVARFAASTLVHGTARRSATQIAEDLEGRGASLNVSPGLEQVAVMGRALPDDLPLLLGLAAEVVTEPAFPADEVEKVRGRLVTSARVSALDTRYVAERSFRSLAYPHGHPHAQPPDGDEAVLTALSRADLLAFHARHARAGSTLLVIVGDVDAGATVEQVAKAFGAWPAGPAWTLPAFAAPRPLERPARVDVAVPGKSQSDLVLGTPGVRRNDPEYYATMVTNLLLGQLGLMGRLGENVRERQGMAYYAFSDLRAGLLAGPWWVKAGVSPTNVERAADAILHEIRTLQRDGPRVDELADARTFLVGSLAVRLETNQGVAQMLADIELFGLGLDYLERYPSIIAGVGRDDVVRAMRRFPADAYTLSVAGPERAA